MKKSSDMGHGMHMGWYSSFVNGKGLQKKNATKTSQVWLRVKDWYFSLFLAWLQIVFNFKKNFSVLYKWVKVHVNDASMCVIQCASFNAWLDFKDLAESRQIGTEITWMRLPQLEGGPWTSCTKYRSFKYGEKGSVAGYIQDCSITPRLTMNYLKRKLLF